MTCPFSETNVHTSFDDDGANPVTTVDCKCWVIVVARPPNQQARRLHSSLVTLFTKAKTGFSLELVDEPNEIPEAVRSIADDNPVYLVESSFPSEKEFADFRSHGEYKAQAAIMATITDAPLMGLFSNGAIEAPTEEQLAKFTDECGCA